MPTRNHSAVMPKTLSTLLLSTLFEAVLVAKANKQGAANLLYVYMSELEDFPADTAQRQIRVQRMSRLHGWHESKHGFHQRWALPKHVIEYSI